MATRVQIREPRLQNSKVCQILRRSRQRCRQTDRNKTKTRLKQLNYQNYNLIQLLQICVILHIFCNMTPFFVKRNTKPFSNLALPSSSGNRSCLRTLGIWRLWRQYFHQSNVTNLIPQILYILLLYIIYNFYIFTKNKYFYK